MHIIRIVTITLFCFGNIIFTHAQQRAVVFGKIKNPTSRTLTFKYDENVINGSQVVVETDIDFNGEYAIAISLEAPTPVYLEYNNKKMLLFLSPDNRLEINFDNTDLYNSMQFSGLGFNDNSFLHRYILEYGMRDAFQESIVFPGISVADSIYNQMNLLSPTDFTTYVSGLQQSERDFFENDPIQQDLSTELKAYFDSMITYKWTSYLFAYAKMQSNRGIEIPDEFYIFLWDLEISNDEAIIHPAYGTFLDIYLEYAFQSMHGDTITNKLQKFALLYELAEMQLDGFAEEYMLGRLLAQAIKPTNIPFITTYYQKFIAASMVNSYRVAVQDIYNRALTFADKQAAPMFTLQDLEGQFISLDNLKGKLVYISFWASWCQPCLKEQQESLANRIELKDQDVVFLYISVDDTEKQWRQFLERHPNYGINVWTKGRGSEVSRLYNVVSLPHYFMIDRQGRFITTFRKASDADFIFEIKKLLEQ